MEQGRMPVVRIGLTVTAVCGVLALFRWASAEEPAEKQPPAADLQQNAPLQLAQAPQRPPRIGQAAAADDEENQEEELVEGVFLPPPWKVKQGLEKARELIADRKYSDSVEFLGSLMDGTLLEGSEDFFYRPDPGQPVYHSLKAEAGKLMAQMPQEGRDRYELLFGARARRMLDEAASRGDAAGLAEISRRYFFTKAGAEATLLLGQHHLDHDRPLAAALCFQRLLDTPAVAPRFEPMLSLSLATCWLRAGMGDKAQQVIVALKQKHPRNDVRIAGQPVKFFQQDSQALAWLAENAGNVTTTDRATVGDWKMFRGDASRNAQSEGSRPLLNLRWLQRVAHFHSIEKLIRERRQSYLDQEIAVLPSMHPLAVGNVVLVRTTHCLQAIDFETGKLVWMYPGPDEIPSSADQTISTGRAVQPFAQVSQAAVHLDQRMWDDTTFGTLSSDGERVYSIEDAFINTTNPRQMIVLPNGQRRFNMPLSRNHNRLVARSLSGEGKLAWIVGGIEGEDEPKLAGAFFLGPPLPLNDRLYALVEMKQEIRLVALSAKTGAVEWSQQLAVVEQNTLQETSRRLNGVTPSYADGVLVCPTSAGALVAVDMTTRSLLWGYQYPRTSMNYTDHRVLMMRQGGLVYTGGERRSNDRWIDATVTIAEGRVLLTPVESDELYCVNLIDGSLAWKQPRDGNLYVAAIHQGKVILIGSREVSAINLEDGEPAWNDGLDLPDDALPSGRGFYSGDHYYLPLTTAEVIQINLTTGTIEARAKSRRGHIPGNLICFKGNVISQSVDYIEAFYQLDALKAQADLALKEHPDDSVALTQHGEIQLDEGNLQEAITLFRRSYQIEPDDYTRGLLVTSLLQGLERDFSTHWETAKELEHLIEQRPEQTAYLRLVAAGLQKSGDNLAAFDTYLKLADEPMERSELDEVRDSLSVRRDRWIQAQLTLLSTQASPDERARMDEIIVERLVAAEADSSPDSLRQFVSLFAGYPVVEAAREKLALKLSGDETLLERELLWRRLEESADGSQSRRATARLASLFDEAGRPDLAGRYYRKLQEQWSNEVCLDGKTGTQIVEALPADAACRAYLAPSQPWPRGFIEVREGGSKKALDPNRYQQRVLNLRMQGDPGPFFSEYTISLDMVQSNNQAIVGVDGLGVERFRIPLPVQSGRRGNLNPFGTPMFNYASVNNHLMLVSLGHQVLALDTLRGSSDSSKRIVWSQDLSEAMTAVTANGGIHPRPSNIAWGLMHYAAYDRTGKRIATMGPVGDDAVCIPRGREVACVNPLTGETLWVRKNLPLGYELFGDGELLFVAPDEGEATVLRAVDGEVLGKRPTIPPEQRMATIGRLVLTWRTQDAKPEISLRDPWAERDLWTRKLQSGAKAWLVGQEAVGIMEQSGEFSLLQLPDGKAIVDREKLEPEDTLASIFVLRSPDQYFLITNTVNRPSYRRSASSPSPAGLNSFMVNGKLYAFDRSTGKKNWGPVAVADRGVLVTQPSEVPVLVFASFSQRSSQRQGAFSITCINKQTGWTVFDNKRVPSVTPGNYEVVADPSESSVDLLLPGKTITFKYTDKPFPPEGEEQSKKDTSAGNIAGAVLRAFGLRVPESSSSEDELPLEQPDDDVEMPDPVEDDPFE